MDEDSPTDSQRGVRQRSLRPVKRGSSLPAQPLGQTKFKLYVRLELSRA